MTYESDQEGVARDRGRRGRHARHRRGDRPRRTASEHLGGAVRERAAGGDAGAGTRARARSRGAAAHPWRRRSTRQRPRAAAPAAGAGAGRRPAPAPRRAGQSLAARAPDRAGERRRPPDADGHGPGGRIVKADVEGARARRARRAAPHRRRRRGADAGAGATAGADGGIRRGRAARRRRSRGWRRPRERRPSWSSTRTQQTIARRMAESKATIPDFSLQIDVDMEGCVALRSELKRLAPRKRAGRQTSARPTTTWSSRRRPWRCASTRAPTAATATGGFSCTHASTWASPSPPTSTGRADRVRRRREVARRDRPRGASAGRAGARGHDHAARARRWHLHRLEPRHVRHPQLHRDHQPAAGGDPVGRRARAARGGARARAACAQHPHAHARLRPPHPLRGRRRACSWRASASCCRRRPR